MAPLLYAFVEGELKEPMAHRLLKEVGLDSAELTMVVAGGCNPFWDRASNYNATAKYVGFVLGLTDLDNHRCPSGLIADKLSEQLHPRFLLRIQVRELESWLLADATAWAKYLRVSEASVPRDPDLLEDPKQALVNLARRCTKRSIRDDIVPEQGSPRIVGRGYTTRISEFITDHWSPSRAAMRSPSLKRALLALRKVAETP